MRIIILTFLLTIGINAALNCTKDNDKYICKDKNIEIELFQMKEKWPIKLDSGIRTQINLKSKTIECFKDENKNEIECFLTINNKLWHLYSKEANLIDSNIVENIYRNLKHSNKPKRVTKKANKFFIVTLNGLIMGDIDGDEIKEVVGWRKFAQKEIGNFYQLLVYKDDGTLLWEGPKVADVDNSYIFGEWDFGLSMPQTLVDINEDNQAELIAPAPQSDVSPTYFRIFNWNGKRFVSTRPAALILSSKSNNHFIWVNPLPSNYKKVWVEEFIHMPIKDSSKVTIFYLDNNGNVNEASAILKFNLTGADVVRWIKPIKDIKKTTNIKENQNFYYAKIGKGDHFNSKGTRLTNLKEILRQDRANFYKGKGDIQDSSIKKFDTFEKRVKMMNMQIEPIGINKRKLEEIVVNNNPLLKVVVGNNTLKVEVLNYK